MIIKRFSATRILDTNSATGFIKGRKYDTDLDRLGRSSTQREMRQELNLRKEIVKAKKQLRRESAGDINSELRKEKSKVWQYIN